jgi:hypothetical protein
MELYSKYVYRVPPSHFIEFDISSNKIDIQNYWQLEKKMNIKIYLTTMLKNIYLCY